MIHGLGLKVGFIGPVNRCDVLANIVIAKQREGNDPRCENTLFWTHPEYQSVIYKPFKEVDPNEFIDICTFID